MKKYLAALTLACASPLVSAIDATPLFSVYAGVGTWQTDFSGQLGDNNTSLDDLGLDSNSSNYFYAAFEHAIPFIPQARLEISSISTDGTGTIEETFELGLGNEITATDDIFTDIDLSFTDATLYYEILMIDFGLTFRSFDAEVMASSQKTGEMIKESVSGVIPMAYLQTKISLPLTGLYVTGAYQGISVADNSVTDLRVAAGYEMELGFLAELGFEAGFRTFEITIDEDGEEISGEIESSGPYLGVNIKF